MTFPHDIATTLKIVGALSAGLGSLLLAWRVKTILKWVVYCLVTHEHAIEQLSKVANNHRVQEPVIGGITRHLLDIESKSGLALLIAGFFLLGLGLLSNAISYFF
jgi:hypothetical protein